MTETDLRPSRYYITDDDYLILSSEVGVLDIDPTKIVIKRASSSGQDAACGYRRREESSMMMSSRRDYADKQPYGEWLDSNLVKLEDLKIPNERVPEYTKEERQRMQKAFGYTYEISARCDPADGKKRWRGHIAAMGIDTPLAALVRVTSQPLYSITSSSCLHR